MSVDPFTRGTVVAQAQGLCPGRLHREEARPSFVNACTGQPLENAEFIQSLEKAMQRRLTLQKRGPLEELVTDRRQGELTFDP
jgi:hypothetical protein